MVCSCECIVDMVMLVLVVYLLGVLLVISVLFIVVLVVDKLKVWCNCMVVIGGLLFLWCVVINMVVLLNVVCVVLVGNCEILRKILCGVFSVGCMVRFLFLWDFVICVSVVCRLLLLVVNVVVSWLCFSCR